MNFLPVVIRVIDSHTGGMPTRLVVAGGPDLPGSTMHDRLADFQTRHDAWRRALTGAPRSAPGTIGAVLTEPERPASLAGLLLFDANGPLERHPDRLAHYRGKPRGARPDATGRSLLQSGPPDRRGR